MTTGMQVLADFVLRCPDRARCRICGSWNARDWWIEFPRWEVCIVRVCRACKATQTEARG